MQPTCTIMSFGFQAKQMHCHCISDIHTV